MASVVPLEDQTDEDFFDKLVDDDFEITGSHNVLADSVESDEVKAIGSLSIADVGTVADDFGNGEINSVPLPKAAEENVLVPEESVSLVPSNTATLSTVTESGATMGVPLDTTPGIPSDPTTHVPSDTTVRKSSGYGVTTVKEMQWTAFSRNSGQTDMTGFSSYADIFTELADGNSSLDPFADAGGKPNADFGASAVVENPVADLIASGSQVDEMVGTQTADGRELYSSHYWESQLADGNSSVDPFADVGSKPNADFGASSIVENPVLDLVASHGQVDGMVGAQAADGQELYSSQYWESLYPGWKYDQLTGEWHQLDGYDATATGQVSFQDKAQSVGDGAIWNQRSEVSYLQQTAQSVVGTVAEYCTVDNISNNWNQVSQGSSSYPAHMVFDPQYPGWYYDTIALEWRLLESYTQASPTVSEVNDHQPEGGNTSVGASVSGTDHGLYDEYGQYKQYPSQDQVVQGQVGKWSGSAKNRTQPSMLQPEPTNGPVAGFSGDKQTGNLYSSTRNLNSYTDPQMGLKTMETISQYGQANHGSQNSNSTIGFETYSSAENLYQFNQPKVEKNQQMHFSSPSYYENQQAVHYSLQQQFQTGNDSCIPFSNASNELRSSVGRPAHALVTFGFGGKLIVMKDGPSSYGSQDPVGASISILNLIEVVDNNNATGTRNGACDYFHALCQQSFPGPLLSGSAAAINKWTDERIADCHSPSMDFKKGELLRLLLSLLKISCQHYGKLRSPFVADSALQDIDGPESAVAKLFASAGKNGNQSTQYGAFTHCMQNFPSEGQQKATAFEVQNLLVTGKRKEALQQAQEGRLWGPALVLAAQLGEQFYVDTVKQMAQNQFISGSPLRTLCLLIAGQPADVFSGDSSVSSHPYDAVNMSAHPAQFHANGMLDEWTENLAIIATNRTKNDELVMIHLGDCLWKERGEVAAAHTCYLVAEANFESYSDSARLCLVGADHWRYPRTYTSPEAIQRTELYEYSKVLGNSQFILVPFQPYKLIYAYMLAEVGKVSDSLRYCQALLKMLKHTGRVPEVETWKSLLSSLEERIRTHQQGGYSTNIAPAKLVGKLFTTIDRSIHRMIGAPPSSVASTSQSSNEHEGNSVVPKVESSQSTMAMSSLMQSASMEPISTLAADGRMAMHSRSVSEPDFSRSPNQGWMASSKESSSTDAQGKTSVGPSRLGLFGSQIFQKTMGWVSSSRPDRQAKLGERNKFYYDEKLKRWVEEGAEPPAEEAALPPPPMTTSFQNGTPDYNLNNAYKSLNLPANGGPEIISPNPSEHSSGIPPIPPSTNQFSARGRMGVRSRYVDTFNKGGGTPTNLFQSPPVPAAKPVGTAKFFVPTPAASEDAMVNGTGESTPELVTNEGPPTSVVKDLSFPLQASSLQQSPSMDSINPLGNKGMGFTRNGNGLISSRSRAASWSGTYDDTFNPKTSEIRPLGEVLGISPPSDPSSVHSNSVSPPMNGGSYSDDLHEVEL